MDVSRGESVEHDLNRLIEKRHDQRTSAEGHRPSEELYEESTRRYQEQLRLKARAEWHLHHTGQAERLRRTLEGLVAYHEEQAGSEKTVRSYTDQPQQTTTNIYFINQVPEGRIEMASKSHRMVLSVDLAKSIDKTAFTVTEVKPVVRQNADGGRIRLASFHVHNITRLEPDRDFRTYADIAKIIHKTYHDKRIWLVKANGKEIEPQLLVDAGGVGDAVCDDLETYMHLKPVRYKLTRGTSHVHQYSLRNWTVPRPLIFQMADSAFGDERIAVRPDLKLAKDLIEDFRNFKRETNEETGSVRVVHREGKHDDMAISLASTVWWTMQPKTGGVSTLRAVPYGSDVAIAKGELDPRSLPVVSRKVKPWRYS